MREREQKRVMSLYNPSLLRKAALEMEDEEIKNRILNIVGENSPKSSNGGRKDDDDDGENSKDDRKKKLFARQKSRRISVSTRNLNRMHTDFHDDQDRLNEEKEVLKQKQRARTKEKLRKKRSFARKQGKLKRKSTRRKTMKKVPHPPSEVEEEEDKRQRNVDQDMDDRNAIIDAQQEALEKKKREIKMLKKQMKKQQKKQKKRQRKLEKDGYGDILSLSQSGNLNSSGGSLNSSMGKAKLPRLVKLNPGMNTMSLSFKPSVNATSNELRRNDSGSTLASLSSIGDRQSDDMINLNTSDDDGYGESESSSISNSSSKKSSSTSTITN